MSEPGNPFAVTPTASASPGRTDVGAHPPPPPLSIAHLLVWTAGTAVILGVGQMVGKLSELPDWIRTYFNVQQAIMAPLTGAAVCSLILPVSRRLTHGPPFPVQPGHWLLLVAGITAVVGWTMHSFQTVALHLWHTDWAGHVGFLCSGIAFGSGIVASIVAGCCLRDRRLWRRYFFASALLHTPVALVWILEFAAEFITSWNGPQHFGIIQIGQMLYVLGELVLVLALFALAVSELARRVRRDWLHWVGVAIGLLIPLLYLFSTVGFRFIGPP